MSYNKAILISVAILAVLLSAVTFAYHTVTLEKEAYNNRQLQIQKCKEASLSLSPNKRVDLGVTEILPGNWVEIYVMGKEYAYYGWLSFSNDKTVVIMDNDDNTTYIAKDKILSCRLTSIGNY